MKSDFIDYYDSIDHLIYYRWNRFFMCKRHNDLQAKSKFLLSSACRDLPKICVSFQNKKVADNDRTIIAGIFGKLYLVALHEYTEESKNQINAFLHYSEYMRSKFSIDPTIDICNRAKKCFPFNEQGFITWNKIYHTHALVPTLFDELKTPVFIIQLENMADSSSYSIILNPCLRDYNFMSIFPHHLLEQKFKEYICI